MADPLSIATSIITVLEAAALTITYLKDVRDAPEDRISFLMELVGLQAILKIIQRRVEESRSGDQWLTAIQELAAKDGPLEKFTADLQRLELRLAPASKFKEMGRRLTWKFGKAEIMEILANIERMKTLASFALTNGQYSLSQAIKSDASKIKTTVEHIWTGLEKTYDDQEYQKIVDWLSPLNFRTSQNDVFRKREEGTGLWLLATQQFKDWIRETRGILWCPGMPGAGKTVLMSMVANYLQKFFQDGMAIACIYCNYQDQTEQTAANLVASLLKQVVEDSSSISDSVRSLYRLHTTRKTRPTLDEYMAVLKSEYQNFSRVFIIVDALDECREDDGTRSALIKVLKSLGERATIMVTSREIPLISQEFQGSPRLDIRAQDQDVRKYTEGRLSRASRPHLHALWDQIVKKIVDNAKGMFLLAQLHIDSIVAKHNIAAVRKALETLPKGMDDSYNEVMKRIECQPEDDRVLAMDVLLWIVYACRPLSVQELQHALAVIPGATSMDSECITDREILISVCAGLVVVDEASGVIRLVHYTTQKYFESRCEDVFPDAASRIARTCLTHLSFDVYGGISHRQGDDVRLSQENPLLNYAALHWGDHACGQAEESCAEMVLAFFRNRSSFEYTRRVLRKDSHRLRPFPPLQEDFSELHMCALFGLTWLISHQLENGTTPNLRDSDACTPLCWAARAGNDGVVRLLVTRDDIEVNSRDNWGRTPLSWAAERGHEAVANALCQRHDVDVNLADNSGHTPLHCAARRGNIEVAKLLLAKKEVEVNRRDSEGSTPLACTVWNEHPEFMRLLLSRDDVNMNVADDRGRTPLHHAASEGHTEIGKLLISRKEVEVNLADKDGLTPLLYAACRGHEEVVRLLLSRDDANVTIADDRGKTPLHHAASGGHAEIVTLLITRKEVEVNLADKDGFTPLLYAAREGRDEVVKLLFSRNDTNVNIVDDRGKTPLHHAASGGHAETMKLLVSRKEVEVNLVDKDGSTPLLYAACRGHEEVVRLLLSRDDANVNILDDCGKTPLHHAASEGHAEILKLFISRKEVEVNLVDKDGLTPLLYAARRGHEEVVRLLLSRDDINGNSADSNDLTPLDWAKKGGHDAMMRILIAL